MAPSGPSQIARLGPLRRRWPAVVTAIVVLPACNAADPTGRGTDRSPSPGPSASPFVGSPGAGPVDGRMQQYEVPAGSRPHDVAPAADGGVWYTAQGSGELGHLDPATGRTRHIGLGDGSAPHGVIVGPDGAAWVTDGGLGAVVRVDPATGSVRRFPVPGPGRANLNTAAFDDTGTLWFTDQGGRYGRVDPPSGRVDVFDAPKGRGPYGICRAADGSIWYSSLAGSYIARVDVSTGQAQIFDVPTAGGGARRVWSDSGGGLWVTEWFAGKLARFDASSRIWREWTLPGDRPQPYAVYVDERDIVWVSDFGANALVRFDPRTETFTSLPHERSGAHVRQLLGRPGEVWGAESGTGRLVVVRTAA